MNISYKNNTAPLEIFMYLCNCIVTSGQRSFNSKARIITTVTAMTSILLNCCTSLHTHEQIHAHTCTRKHAYTHTCVQKCMHAHACSNLYERSCMYTHAYEYIHASTIINADSFTFMNSHACKDTH